jgi:hypothetical protein
MNEWNEVCSLFIVILDQKVVSTVTQNLGLGTYHFPGTQNSGGVPYELF